MFTTKRFLSVNKFSRPGTKLSAVRGIVVHYTGNAGSSALQNRDYFESLKNQSEENARYASAHFVVGLQGEVMQCLPTNEVAYHAGAKKYVSGIQDKLGSYPNASTIGIEMCHPCADGRFTKETYESAVELSALLLRKFQLNPLTDLYRHFDITKKLCPKFFVENPSAWNAFRADVEKFLIGVL